MSEDIFSTSLSQASRPFEGPKPDSGAEQGDSRAPEDTTTTMRDENNGDRSDRVEGTATVEVTNDPTIGEEANVQDGAHMGDTKKNTETPQAQDEITPSIEKADSGELMILFADSLAENKLDDDALAKFAEQAARLKDMGLLAIFMQEITTRRAAKTAEDQLRVAETTLTAANIQKQALEQHGYIMEAHIRAIENLRF